MKKFFYDRRIVFMYLFTIIFLMVGMTYALQSSSLSLGLTTALVGIDEDAYGSTDFDSSEIDFKPILDSEVETSPENVIKIDFTVGGAETNNNENIIYDIALNNLNVNCNLISPYIKWKLIKDETEVFSGSLDYKFDTIDENGRLVLTTIQEDLPDYNAEDKSTYDDYTFYMWFSDSCQSDDITTCTSAVDQSSLLGQNLSGRVEVELYTESKQELTRNPGTTTTDSLCDGAYAVSFVTNGGSEEENISVFVGSTYGSLPTPTRTDVVTFDTLGGNDIVEVNNTSGDDTFVIGTSNTFGISPKIKLLSDTNTKSVTYTFEGWYKDKELTNPVTEETLVTQEKNHELYAKWGGDNKITLPSVTKVNNEFLGWYSDKELKTKIGDAGDTYEVIADKTLYAGWDSSYVTIYLNSNGGTGGLSTIYVVPGDGFYSDETLTNKITEIETLPTRTGYTFQGYEGLADSEGNITASSNDFTEEVTISANWLIDTYQVKFIDDRFQPVSSQTVEGITATYDQETSYLVLNGTNTSTRISFQLIDYGNFVVGEQYELSVTYISGSYSGSVTQEKSSISIEVVTSDNSNLSERVYADRVLPLSGELTNTLTISELAATSGKYLNAHIWISEVNGLTFSDYTIKVTVRKVADKQIDYGNSLGTLPAPTRTGYTFGGWYTETNGEGTMATESTVISEGDLNYYAKWTINTYTITYDANGGSGTMESTSYIYGSGNFNLPENTYTRTGYTFSHWRMYRTTDQKWYGCTDTSVACTGSAGNTTFGWYTEDEIGAYYQPAPGWGFNSYHAHDMIFYAQWTINTYTVTYDNNIFTTYASETLSGVEVTYDPNTSYLTLNGTQTSTRVNLLTLGGMTFSEGEQYRITGTYVSGSYTATTNGTIATDILKSDLTSLTTRNNSDIYFPTSGTNSTVLTVKSTTVSEGGALQLWLWNETASTWSYSNYTIRIDVTKVVTATATYGSKLEDVTKPNKSYTVTFNTNDGSNTITSSTATYTFGGYYSEPNGAGVQYHDSDGKGITIWELTSDADLYAKYTATSITLPTPTRTGYTFNGWYTAASGGVNIGVGGDTYVPHYNQTVYAQWTVNNYYIDLNWNLDGSNWRNSDATVACAVIEIDDVSQGCVADFYYEYPQGTKFEITSIKLNGTTVSYTYSGTVNGAYLGHSVAVNTLTISSNNTSYGTVSASSLYVKTGTTYTTSGATFTLSDGRKVTASVTDAAGYITSFSSWTSTATGTINSLTTVTANFTRSTANYSISNPATGKNTFAEAIAVAVAGATISLNVSQVTEGTVTINKNITLNTNGKTWNGTGTIAVNSGITATITGSGTMTSTATLISNSGTLTINHSGTMSAGGDGIYNNASGILYVKAINLTADMSGISTIGQTEITGGTINAVGPAVQNGGSSINTGLLWITAGTFITSGGRGAIKNFSDETWPTSGTTKIETCSRACTVHITEAAQISNTGTYYGVHNDSISGTGLIHFPWSFYGYVHAKENYVLRANSGDIWMYGGNVYAEGSKTFSAATGYEVDTSSVTIYYTAP